MKNYLTSEARGREKGNISIYSGWAPDRVRKSETHEKGGNMIKMKPPQEEEWTVAWVAGRSGELGHKKHGKSRNMSKVS